MTKHHWRQQIKSLFKSHVDPDKHQLLEQTRKEMEEKKGKIMNLIKANGSNDNTETLEVLLNDYHKQYELLYEAHHDLTQELHKNLHKKKNGNTSSDSDSDSDDSSSSKISYSKLEKENVALKSRVMDLELNLRSIERKGNDSNSNTIMDLQTTIESLKREIETEKDELTTIEEKNRNLEVMLRLSNQKNRVTEQMLVDKETSYKVVLERNLELKRSLEEYSGMIRGISRQVNDSLGEVEMGIMTRFDKAYGGLIKSVVRLCEQVESLKSSVKGLKEDEKDERIRILEEEKREAIRQLCVWNEYCRTKNVT